MDERMPDGTPIVIANRVIDSRPSRRRQWQFWRRKEAGIVAYWRQQKENDGR